MFIRTKKLIQTGNKSILAEFHSYMNGVLNGSLCHVIIFAFCISRVRGNINKLLWFCMINKIAELRVGHSVVDLFHMARSAFSRRSLLRWSGVEGYTDKKRQFGSLPASTLLLSHPWQSSLFQRNNIILVTLIYNTICAISQYLVYDLKVIVLLKDEEVNCDFYSVSLYNDICYSL